MWIFSKYRNKMCFQARCGVEEKYSTKEAGRYIEELTHFLHRWAIDEAGQCGAGAGEQGNQPLRVAGGQQEANIPSSIFRDTGPSDFGASNGRVDSTSSSHLEVVENLVAEVWVNENDVATGSVISSDAS